MFIEKDYKILNLNHFTSIDLNEDIICFVRDTSADQGEVEIIFTFDNAIDASVGYELIVDGIKTKKDFINLD